MESFCFLKSRYLLTEGYYYDGSIDQYQFLLGCDYKLIDSDDEILRFDIGDCVIEVDPSAHIEMPEFKYNVDTKPHVVVYSTDVFCPQFVKYIRDEISKHQNKNVNK